MFFREGEGRPVLEGGLELGFRRWHHVVLVREPQRVRVYLDGELAIDGAVTGAGRTGGAELFVGGRSDNRDNFEGKLDEVAVYERALQPDEVRAHHRIAGRTARAGNPRSSPPAGR